MSQNDHIRELLPDAVNILHREFLVNLTAPSPPNHYLPAGRYRNILPKVILNWIGGTYKRHLGFLRHITR
jgi:hypothetical protein